jgi:hypothetical protein
LRLEGEIALMVKWLKDYANIDHECKFGAIQGLAVLHLGADWKLIKGGIFQRRGERRDCLKTYRKALEEFMGPLREEFLKEATARYPEEVKKLAQSRPHQYKVVTQRLHIGKSRRVCGPEHVENFRPSEKIVSDHRGKYATLGDGTHTVSHTSYSPPIFPFNIANSLTVNRQTTVTRLPGLTAQTEQVVTQQQTPLASVGTSNDETSGIMPHMQGFARQQGFTTSPSPAVTTPQSHTY